MLDVLDVAREKGLEEGKLENAREMLLDALFEKFGAISPRISTLIRTLRNQDTLKFLFRQVFRCDDLHAFEKILSSME